MPRGLAKRITTMDSSAVGIQRAIDGLEVSTIRKPTNQCQGARRGDQVTVRYEGRVASPVGPIYDSTEERGGKPTTFVLGSGKALPGVDIGLQDMCPSEIRELDIPTSLGYGRGGSTVFDIPGDVRLWWKVELLELNKK